MSATKTISDLRLANGSLAGAYVKARREAGASDDQIIEEVRQMTGITPPTVAGAIEKSLRTNTPPAGTFRFTGVGLDELKKERGNDEPSDRLPVEHRNSPWA